MEPDTLSASGKNKTVLLPVMRQVYKMSMPQIIRGICSFDKNPEDDGSPPRDKLEQKAKTSHTEHSIVHTLSVKKQNKKKQQPHKLSTASHVETNQPACQ